MLRPGDLIELPAGVSGRVGTNAVVISVAHRGKGAIRIRAVDGAAELHRFDAADLDSPLHPHGHADLPTPYAPENTDFIDACAALVVLDGAIGSRPRAAVGSASHQLRELREELADHPAHACPDLDTHLAAIGERAKVKADTERLQAAVQRRSGLIAARLDAVVDLLEHLGCARGWALTERGERLASIYHESDLLMALALDEGIFDGLSSPEMAATVSACVYEERRKDVVVSPRAYTSLTSQRLGDLDRLAGELRRAERERGLPVSGEPDRGFAHHAWSWARGEELVDVLGDEFSAGDFVRNVKLLIDVLGQIAGVAPKPETASVARDAARSLLRGVVAAGEATLA